MAITGIVMGCLGLLSYGFLFGVAAIVLGAIALTMHGDRDSGCQGSAYAMAAASIPLGIISIGLMALMIYFIGLWLDAWGEVTSTWKYAINNDINR